MLPIFLSEPRAHSRLGSAFASLGDVNQDGYNDIAVGAPYANEGSGIVLIFSGSSNGIHNETIAILKPEPSIKGFGISISRGVDIDDNKLNGK